MQGINASTDEGHTAPIAECSCSDILRGEAQGGPKVCTAGLEGGGDHLGGHVTTTRWIKVGVQGSICGGAMLAKIEYLTQHGLDGGHRGVRGVALSDCLVTLTIFLVGEVEQHSSSLAEVTFRGCSSIEQPPGGGEGDVL